MRTAAALAGGLLAASAAAFADPVRVDIEWRAVAGAPAARAVRLSAEPRAIPGTASAPTEHGMVSAANAAVLDLAPGPWTVVASADGFWSAPVEVEVGKAPRAAAHVVMWPASSLSGELVAASGTPLPVVVDLRLESVPATLRCPVTGERWQCAAPAGVFDLEVRSPGFIPHYVWDAALSAGRETRLGTFPLRRGASIAGRIARAPGAVAPGPCRVEVATAPTAMAAPADAPHAVPTGTRGFFQLAGVPPGEHTLSVECPGARATRVVTVRPDAETRLREPIMVGGLGMAVEVVPPRDPWGRPWRLDVFDATAGRRPIAVNEPASAQGRWSRQALPAGLYQVDLRSEDGSQWLSQEHELGERSARLTLHASVLKVSGTVLLARGPLRAHLAFVDEAGTARVLFESGDDGRFGGYLPGRSESPSLAWSVDVSATAPPVNRRLENVMVRATSKEEGAWIDLLVPNAAARGIVLSEEGEPQQGVQVLSESLDTTRHTHLATTDDEGSFELSGLPAGPYRVTAEGTHAVSTPQEVTIGADVEPELRLVLNRRKRLLVGEVQASGAPVPGATIHVWLPPGVPRGSSPSDSGGRFEVSVPGDVQEIGLTVGAPAQALRMTRLSVTEAGPIAIPLDTAAGTLVLEALPETDDQDEPGSAFLIHDGAVESLAAMTDWGAENGGGRDGNRVVVPRIEPGLYSLCWLRPRDVPAAWAGSLPEDRCRAGTLSAGGSLWLSLPASVFGGSSR